jgi:hypothetical protein
MKPRVFNKSLDKDIPLRAVYVGRPTKWGNPWSHRSSNLEHVHLVANRTDAVFAYGDWILSDHPAAVRLRQDAREELRGKHLICWCSPKPCHADILLDIANGEEA